MEHHEMTVKAEDCQVPDCPIHWKKPAGPVDVRTILTDPRPIKAIYPVFDIGETGGWKATEILEIVPYAEPGQMAHVPFLAVVIDGKVVARYPAHAMEVHYR
jgi:hypothetical protein